MSETENYNGGKASLRSSWDVEQESWTKSGPQWRRMFGSSVQTQGSRSAYVPSEKMAHLRRQADNSGILDRDNEINVEVLYMEHRLRMKSVSSGMLRREV